MKIMKKVKSQWVAVGKTAFAVAAIATATIGISGSQVEAVEDKDALKTELSLPNETDKEVNKTNKKECFITCFSKIPHFVKAC